MSSEVPCRLGIVSDLHGEHDPHWDVNPEGCDVLIAAGDIWKGGRESVARLAALGVPVLYVLGNHECEGHTIDSAVALLRAQAEGTQVHILHRDAIELNGVRFLGITGWTDFTLFGEGEIRTRAMRRVMDRMPEFEHIRGPRGNFTAADVIEAHHTDMSWLEAQLDQPTTLPTVVISHFALSRHSLAERFADDLLSAYFVTDRTPLMPKAALWVHGHTHTSFTYRVGEDPTRGAVVCNPRGRVRRFSRHDQAKMAPDERERWLTLNPSWAHCDEWVFRENLAFRAPLVLDIHPASGLTHLDPLPTPPSARMIP